MKDLIYIFAIIVIITLLPINYTNRKRRKKHNLVFTTIINNTQIKILSMQLEKQSFVSTILALIDRDTQVSITATFENVQLTSSDPSIFTADTDVDADSAIDIVGVSVGKATLTVKADATYVDANTGEELTTPEEATIEIEVSAPPPTAQNTDLVVKFSDPKPVPNS